MLIRLLAAGLLGALIGYERETIGKEAGVRTDMLVAMGSAVFSMVSLVLPYLIALPALGQDHIAEILARNGGALRTISNVVVGVGFLGAGIIFREGGRVKGMTTAASIWFVAAVGMLVGIGLIKLAVVASIVVVVALYGLRKVDFYRFTRKSRKRKSRKSS